MSQTKWWIEIFEALPIQHTFARSKCQSHISSTQKDQTPCRDVEFFWGFIDGRKSQAQRSLVDSVSYLGQYLEGWPPFQSPRFGLGHPWGLTKLMITALDDNTLELHYLLFPGVTITSWYHKCPIYVPSMPVLASFWSIKPTANFWSCSSKTALIATMITTWDPPSQEGHIRLTDFGLSKELGIFGHKWA